MLPMYPALWDMLLCWLYYFVLKITPSHSPPKNVCILILRTYGFVTLNGISDFENMVKDLEMESLSQIIKVGPIWSQGP